MRQKATNTQDVSKFGPKLERKHRELIILRLAEFVTYEKIVEELRKDYAQEITRHTVDYYARKHDEVSKKREALNTHLENIPHANKFIRLRMLDKDIEQLDGRDDPESLKIKREYMEQARKEKEGLRVDVTKRDAWTPDQFKHLKDKEDLDRAIKEAEKKDGETLTVAEVLGEGEEKE